MPMHKFGHFLQEDARFCRASPHLSPPLPLNLYPQHIRFPGMTTTTSRFATGLSHPPRNFISLAFPHRSRIIVGFYDRWTPDTLELALVLDIGSQHLCPHRISHRCHRHQLHLMTRPLSEAMQTRLHAEEDF